jgi:UDP-N-acetylglucosamine--N-acetylmuramyl-(pentapeptide) pyrophosphoryl-undecaprenol N-acetylglucosamine transferase
MSAGISELEIAPDAPLPPQPVRLRLCLAASGGGHVRQLLDLQQVWAGHDYFFVTEDTALGRTLAEQHRTYFLPHFAWGQAKLGTPFLMLARAAASLFRSAQIILRERPQVVISTGAGAIFFPVVLARLLGATVVVIESFARFEKPSLFGRMAAPFAHHFIVQSPKLASHYPRAHVFDPLRILEGSPPPKSELLFATVGATLPFDRLIESVDELNKQGAIPERVIMQTGLGGRTPPGIDVFETLPFQQVQDILREASIVVCHGGTGSLITALRQGCQVISLPRRFHLGEHYDDHQAEITEAFVNRGLVLMANSTEELRAALVQARTRAPIMATTDPVQLVAFLETLLSLPAAERTKRQA